MVVCPVLEIGNAAYSKFWIRCIDVSCNDKVQCCFL